MFLDLSASIGVRDGKASLLHSMLLAKAVRTLEEFLLQLDSLRYPSRSKSSAICIHAQVIQLIAVTHLYAVHI